MRRAFADAWEDQLNLTDPATLVKMADVFGSPGQVLDGEVFWGQNRIELLADALKCGRAPGRSHA